MHGEQMRPIATDVCLCVSLLDTIVSPAKTVEPIEMPSTMWTQWSYGTMWWGRIPQGKGQFGGIAPVMRPYVEILSICFNSSCCF